MTSSKALWCDCAKRRHAAEKMPRSQVPWLTLIPLAPSSMGKGERLRKPATCVAAALFFMDLGPSKWTVVLPSKSTPQTRWMRYS